MYNSIFKKLMTKLTDRYEHFVYKSGLIFDDLPTITKSDIMRQGEWFCVVGDHQVIDTKPLKH